MVWFIWLILDLNWIFLPFSKELSSLQRFISAVPVEDRFWARENFVGPHSASATTWIWRFPIHVQFSRGNPVWRACLPLSQWQHVLQLQVYSQERFPYRRHEVLLPYRYTQQWYPTNTKELRKARSVRNLLVHSCCILCFDNARVRIWCSLRYNNIRTRPSPKIYQERQTFIMGCAA